MPRSRVARPRRAPDAPASQARSEPKASVVHQAGLTLLEVLGAVALLAILYTVLAGNAIEGLRSEGESRRRLEASLLADEALAEIELALASGTPPQTGQDEEQREGFRIVTEVRPLELPPREERKTEEPTSLEAKRAAERREIENVPSLFSAPQTGKQPALLDIEVVVHWEDGTFERELRRRTYALDAAAVEAAFATAAALRPQQPEETTGEEDQQDQQGQSGQRGRRKNRRSLESEPEAQPTGGALITPPGEAQTR